MRKIALALSAFVALFMLTGCPKDQVNVAGNADGDETVVDQDQGINDDADEDDEDDDEDEEGGAATDAQTPQTPMTSQAPTAGSAGGLLGSIYFDFDKFVIRTNMQGVIDSVANQALEDEEEPMSLVVEGNTDEFGTDEYNYALGTKRAIAVRDALVVKGVNRDSIRVVSFGESKPICTEKTQDCYQRNRRADVKEAE